MWILCVGWPDAPEADEMGMQGMSGGDGTSLQQGHASELVELDLSLPHRGRRSLMTRALSPKALVLT